jgi:hypothetical protein
VGAGHTAAVPASSGWPEGCSQARAGATPGAPRLQHCAALCVVWRPPWQCSCALPPRHDRMALRALSCWARAALPGPSTSCNFPQLPPPPGANFSQAYSGTWGWSDAGCGTLAPALCKLPPPGNFTYDAAAADGGGLAARHCKWARQAPHGAALLNLPAASSSCVGPDLTGTGGMWATRGSGVVSLASPRPAVAAIANAHAGGDPGSGITYTLSTTAASFAEAQVACNNQGAHLAAFDTLAAQQEMEAVGCLAPAATTATPVPPPLCRRRLLSGGSALP